MDPSNYGYESSNTPPLPAPPNYSTTKNPGGQMSQSDRLNAYSSR